MNYLHKSVDHKTLCLPLFTRQLLGIHQRPGSTTERIYVHIGEIDASVVKPGSVHGLSKNEDIRVHVISREEAYQWVELGVIDNAATVIAIQWLQLNHPDIDKVLMLK